MKNCKSRCESMRQIHAFFVIMACMAVSACGAREAELTWIEPVRLSSGEEVRIKRHVVMIHERAWGGGFSSAPIYKRSSIELVDGGSNFPVWDAPLVPLVIDKDPANGEWLIVASIDECGMWARNGRPRPPYWAFRLREREWFRDAIPHALIDRPANLFVEMEVSDTSRKLGEYIEKRKQAQKSEPRHPKKYSKIDGVGQFEHCDRRPSNPVGANELDLGRFRSLK